ncbi:metabolite traffic protein EboE [Cryptosporangium phraense]|uniref:Metabolite traffic protein EboE n=1 Tax=Cryptosporangium phraense TaxID=2593070 RepID=A0A545AQ00_9ACTN|nr:metabolite traffic protein EboE [Cryptosporangium phraense]TQS43399.1 hypothetical protein FL583_19395 [Cryptosporangium phraense]
MDLGAGRGHLSYSTLVHAGDTWAEMDASLRTHVPAVKAAVSPDQPFAVSLRLSAASVGTLIGDPRERGRLKSYLDANDLYVYTVNAFPYGPFKGGPVKERVYEPDWTTDDRARYTMGVADILAEISPPSVHPSIQTAPLAYRPNVTGEAYVDACTRQVLRVVAHLVGLERRTGRRVTLAIEPEPHCYLETTDETVTYFTERLYPAAPELARLAGIPVSEAIGALRRHVGVVFDIGHQAVGFEDIPDSLRKLVAAGIPIFKLQAAAALWISRVTAEAVEAARAFTDTIYLSQTVERRDGRTTRYLDLEDALYAWEKDPGDRELRTHFHVPVFLDDLGPFRTTRFAVEEAFRMHRETPLSEHLEIETYTWDVLPPGLKHGGIDDYVRRELDFVRGLVLGDGAV